MKMIPQSSPKASYLAHREAIGQAVARVLDSGWYILGSETRAFEEEFAGYLGVRHAIGVANGTDAVALALRACGVGEGMQVATVAHTAIATIAAIEMAGGRPMFVDIDAATYGMDPEKLDATLAAHPGQIGAVVLVHLYGRPADVRAIASICDRHGVALIEDCAQAHGATVAGRRVGTWGRAAAFSFYPTKNLGALGDGGAVATSEDAVAERLRLLRQYGWKERNNSLIAGVNSRLDELQAAILRVKLPALDAENSARRRIAGRYTELLQGTGLHLPGLDEGHVFHQYVIRSAQRTALIDDLRRAGIETAIHYPIPAHLQAAYRGRCGVGSGGLGVTERIVGEILSLPMFPQLPEVDAERVGGAVREGATRV